MSQRNKAIRFSINHPMTITIVMVMITIVLGALISMVRVDTDPENMLAENEPVRVFHNLTKKEFSLHDVIVLGVVNEKHPDGVFNVETLKHVHDLTEFARGLRDPARPEWHVVTRDLM
ncbi:MAG: RND transporter, partial [Thermodesulfovibrionia bacterium]|nr:RND transporter [Thermodesulfovibrionia bacterium]